MARILNYQFWKKGEVKSAIGQQGKPPDSMSFAMRPYPPLPGCGERIEVRGHPCILDFHCPAANLAIELDGGGHDYQSWRIRDRRRAQVLVRRRTILLRFWNHQVRQELERVLQAIWFAFDEARGGIPHPSPLPCEGRGDPAVRSIVGSI